jgi:hypothetical protein
MPSKVSGPTGGPAIYHDELMGSERETSGLDQERLLADWRWLCPQRVTLIEHSAFGDLFLRDDAGKVFLLNVSVGRLSLIAETQPEFITQLEDDAKREEWFGESDSLAFAERGLIPGPDQCIGFSVPLVFADSDALRTPYIANIYDCVGCLGDIHRQIANLPDRAKVELVVE